MDQDLSARIRRQRDLDAADRQGLIALSRDLERRGVGAEIENTGGYCMALVWRVPADDGSEEFVVATHDDRWYVARYTQDEWHDGDYRRRGMPIPHGFDRRVDAANAFAQLTRNVLPHAASFERSI
ncbi:hypothetical protein [Nocardioides jejuensis]|uniref:Uncharacterized protein n=1 Tax=Nocardioides jejuensis TaxID=2502782 RepID=A0A4V2NXK8_9ACTN|nr:hypothetical protein [Nocardioides jejuensis]TCJ21662.1 hypothetical protein EPD65_14640 [Nocardioides jejuensis]